MTDQHRLKEVGSRLGLLLTLAAIGPVSLLPHKAIAASSDHVTVAVTPRTLPADGTSQGSVKAIVTDASGAPLANQAVTFTTTGNETLVPAAATTGSDGSAAVTVIASTAAGAYPITATLVDGTMTAPRATAILYDGPGWSLWNPPTSAAPTTAAVPPGRVDPSMAYDAGRHNVVLFGGSGNWLTRTGLLSTAAGFDDTWTWDGTSWTQRQPATSPPPGGLAAMAYDPGTGKVVRFGGQAFPVTAGQSVVMPNPGYVTVVNDTWTWDGTTWTKEATPPALTARTDASLAWDGHGLVLFGGSGCTDTDPTLSLCSDTWRWGPLAGGGTGWTQLSPPVSPPGRAAAAMVYDQASGTDLLFSGVTGQALNDTWSWNGGTERWTELNPGTSPSSRFHALAAYDAETQTVVLSGGIALDRNGGETPTADTWTWNGSTWTQQSPATSPPSTDLPSFADGAAAFDDLTRTMVVLGPGQPVIPSPLSGLTPLLSQTWTYLDASATTVTLSPPVIAANGVATSTATAVVVGVDGTPSSPAAGESVTFRTSPGGDVAISPLSPGPAGTYRASITASRTADAETIMATPVLATVGGSALLVETGYGAALTPTGGLAFGSQPVGATGAPQAVTLSNTSTFPMAITGISSSLSDFALTSGCPASPATLPSGASCPIAVAFTPSKTGIRSGTLSVTDNAIRSPQTMSLTGTGVAALGGDASALRLEGVTLLSRTAAQHLPDGSQGICEAGPVTAAGTSMSRGSGVPGCQSSTSSGQLLPLMAETSATETVSTGSGGAQAHSNVASLSLLPGLGLSGADVLDVNGLDAQASAPCAGGGGGTATGSSSIAGAVLVNGTRVATQPVGSRIIFNPTGRNPITLYGNPITVNPTGSRVPMAIVTLNYSRHDPATNTQVSSPLEVEFPAGGALSSVIVGRVFISYAASGAQGCQ